MTWVGAILLVLVAAAVTVWWRRRHMSATKESPAEARARIARAEEPSAALLALKRSDVVGLDDDMWLVEGSIHFDEDGYRWSEHILVDGDRRFWLSAEEDDGQTIITRWDRVRAPGLLPGSATVAHDGVEYALEEHGTASYTADGAIGIAPSGTAEYHDYAAGPRKLAFERFSTNGDWEVSVGIDVPAHAFTVYPGRGAPEA